MRTINSWKVKTREQILDELRKKYPKSEDCPFGKLLTDTRVLYQFKTLSGKIKSRWRKRKAVWEDPAAHDCCPYCGAADGKLHNFPDDAHQCPDERCPNCFPDNLTDCDCCYQYAADYEMQQATRDRFAAEARAELQAIRKRGYAVGTNIFDDLDTADKGQNEIS